MRIRVFSDTVCPWCYIGKRRLAAALKQRPDVAFELVWHPFQLNPEMSPGGTDRIAYLAAKFGSRAKVEQSDKQLRELGAGVGIDFTGRNNRIPNTLDSHRLVMWAQELGKQELMADILYRRYFTEGQDLGNHLVLTQAAGEAGLDAAEVSDRLATDADLDEVRELDAQARQAGVSGVPTFLFDDRYAVVGAHEPEVLLEVVDAVLAEEKAAKKPAAKARGA